MCLGVKEQITQAESEGRGGEMGAAEAILQGKLVADGRQKEQKGRKEIRERNEGKNVKWNHRERVSVKGEG